MTLASISEVQALTQQTYSSSTKPTDTQVSAWLSEVDTWIEEYTGIKFSSTAATAEKHDGNGTVYIKTDYYPIIAISNLTVDDNVLTADTDYWIVDAEGGLIECATAPVEREEGTTTGHQNVSITYTHGKTTVPQNIKELCATIVALRAISAAIMASTSSGALKSYSDGDLSISYADGDSVSSVLLKRYQELKELTPKKISMVVGSP